ncbi:hypothetical protein B0A50_01044 [Salinomyces thailandicus]|uniref:Uncharacterized protein n=1 Tax=Salinomyces thailandicus TaxID=706561 RepID=A0A4V5N6I9_9PEZI|nr:hypothetical protein B0A50_01044 [Salinomyces thailandica]
MTDNRTATDATSRGQSPAADVRWAQDFDFASNDTTLRANLPTTFDPKSGVTIQPARHLASKVWGRNRRSDNATEFLEAVLPPGNFQDPEDDSPHGTIIQSSTTLNPSATIQTRRNGFVYAAVEAYSRHHHLRIRPEDIWLAILTQFSAYINAHAEELRGSFVAHEGKKSLEVQYDSGTRFTVDYTDFTEKIGLMIQDNVVDPDLRQWILPAFTTTTQHDVAVANIVMMASMQSYFEYVCGIICGLPSVTLLGEKADYELILQRIEKLRDYGEEPTRFANLLTPILKRFIRSFDDPEDEETLDFWNHILSSYNMGSGSDQYSGWITAFTFWSKDGTVFRETPTSEEELPPLVLDEVQYPRIDSEDVAPGFCTVPVLIRDNGDEVQAEMLAGSVAIEVSSSGNEVEKGERGDLDTMQARSEWWIYEKGPS